MDLSQIPTRELIDAIKTRVDTLLVLGIVVEEDKSLSFHRFFEGINSWSMVMPLTAEIRHLNLSFDWVPDEDEDQSLPVSVIEF